ncbi:MAG: hypothetical protein HY320_05675 [Armatimonadetes bacterium]|nr:hypothetical protein [Armatimonadota bacterium]
MGEARYTTLIRQGYLEFPSRLRRGRVYRLDSSGNLSCRDPGQSTSSTTLCIQSTEPVPRADVLALRYLMVTADEPGLLATANPVRFSLRAITIAIYRDARERYGGLGAFLYTLGVLGLFLAALAVEGASAVGLLSACPVVGLILCVLAAPVAVLGFVLVLAGLADLWMLVVGGICRLWGSDAAPLPEGVGPLEDG